MFDLIPGYNGPAKLTHQINHHKAYSLRKESPAAQQVKNLPATQKTKGDEGSILGSGRSYGGGNGKPLQYSCLEPMHRGAWQATVLGVTESDTTEQLTLSFFLVAFLELIRHD